MGRLRSPAELDAVTVDAYGTLVELVDPVPALTRALATRGIERSAEQIRAAFEAEAAYYGPRSSEGRDEPSLARLREACASVFLEALDAELPAAEFAPAYVEALEFRLLPGTTDALARLRALGLDLAVVANWDVSIHDRLGELGLARWFSVVLTAAEAGARKPDAQIFGTALERLRVAPDRALHVGDQPEDEEGARAAGMHFAPAPLPVALTGWT